jgi:hypothetical protein
LFTAQAHNRAVNKTADNRIALSMSPSVHASPPRKYVGDVTGRDYKTFGRFECRC